MKKKVFVLLTVLCLLCSSFTGCTSPNTPAKENDQTMEQLQKDPTQDNTINILMIGNSFCYFYVEELYGMAKAAGIDMRICNVYYSGCQILQHWQWWQAKESKYEFFTTDENGRVKTAGVDLEYCLQQHNWDIITLQDGGNYRKLYEKDAKEVFEDTKPAAKLLLDMLKARFPKSQFYWHHTWSAEIGYHSGYGFAVNSVADQTVYEKKMAELANLICEELRLPRISSGTAWPIARKSPLASNLCARVGIDRPGTYTGGPNTGDGYHDGDIGGGQYLNACVWFETLTGQSCIGNPYRPSYGNNRTLSEELITVLQNAAHQAVRVA